MPEVPLKSWAFLHMKSASVEHIGSDHVPSGCMIRPFGTTHVYTAALLKDYFSRKASKIAPQCKHDDSQMQTEQTALAEHNSSSS